jgi:uncharacterized protein YukE
MNIEINVNKVNEETNKLIDISQRLKEIEEESVSLTDTLKDYWESKTSEYFYKDFDQYKNEFDNYLEECTKIINYLQDVVSGGYKEFDETTNNKIDENFSV